jgi:hypothetical protein
LSRNPKQPPKLGDSYSVNISASLPVRQYVRLVPENDLEEYQINISKWALPVIFEWLPPEVIIWALGLLFGEAKLLVVGSDPGIMYEIIKIYKLN